MGRDIGTNVYSNNFEPQVMGLLDARTRVDTKADLTKDATWTSSDGNTYVPVGIRVSVTDDTTNGNNGVYMLMSEDYAIASNWMQINSSSGGGSEELVMVDLSFINTIPGTYTPDRYLMGELIKIQDALSIDIPFFVYQFNNEFGQFPTSAISDGINLTLTILYRDEVWLIDFDGTQYTTSKGGTSPLTNVKVLTTSGLLNTSRKGDLYLSSSDITIWKNIELGRDIIVYSGSIAQEKQYVPLSISSQGEGSSQVAIVTYMLYDSMYSFKITYDNPTRYLASGVKKIEGGGDKTIYLTTEGILDIGGDTELNQQDIDALTKLYTENNSAITNIVYVGTESGGNQFLVPLSCYSDFGGASVMDVLFLHPWQQKVYHMAIDVFATPPIAYDPEEVIFDSGGASSSNVKVLRTPDLLSASRLTTINLSAADAAIIKGLSIGKGLVVYNGMNGASEQYTPLSMNSVVSGTTHIVLLSYLFADSRYSVTITGHTSSNTYTASKPIKIEGSGGGYSSKFYTTTLNLGDISTRDNKASLDEERIEVDNIISKVQEGYTILSVQNDIGVNDNNSRYGVVGVTLSEDKKEIWMQVVDQWNVLTISYNKKVLGAPFYCHYLQRKTEIVELPADASTNIPYENGYYDGSNMDFANKIREISINPTKKYVLKYSPNGYYTVINPYAASNYAGFYVCTNDDSLHFYTDSGQGIADYTVQSEGSVFVKQDLLVSGKNIKTINGQSVLGSGNIDISGGSGSGSNIDIVDLTTLTLEEVSTSTEPSEAIRTELEKVLTNATKGSTVIVRSTYKSYTTFTFGTTEVQRYCYLEFDSGDKTRWRVTISTSTSNMRYKIENISRTHDLSIDVKTYSSQGIAPTIYFRIKDIVPNGRIHFVRKKRMRYFDRNDNLIRSLGYAVMEADCHNEGGVDVSTLTPNTWYEYPITDIDLISSYPPGSSVNGKVRTHGVIRFKGATYAKSFEFKNAPFTQTQTTLHAGLQYNVLSGKKSPLFKERGEVVPIDVRLTILNASNYNAGYEYSYAVQ